MSLIFRIQNAIRAKGYSHEKEIDGVIEYTIHFYEMKYEKYDTLFYIVFTAPNDADASIKSKSVLNNFGGEKIHSIRRLDGKSLGKSLTWNKKGNK